MTDTGMTDNPRYVNLDEAVEAVKTIDSLYQESREYAYARMRLLALELIEQMGAMRCK